MESSLHSSAACDSIAIVAMFERCLPPKQDLLATYDRRTGSPDLVSFYLSVVTPSKGWCIPHTAMIPIQYLVKNLAKSLNISRSHLDIDKPLARLESMRAKR